MQDPESDLGSELLALQSQLCLAQAQECILEKSILDSRKPMIVAKVCSQVVEYYKQALRHLDANGSRDEHMDSLGDVVGSKQMKSWRTFIEFKVQYYGALGFLHGGMVAEESQRMGERVAFYQAASESLGLAGKLGGKLEGTHRDVGDALQYSSDVINGKLDNAKKENEFIYHEKVPEKDALQHVKGASLVKGIGWDSSDPEVSGPDLFARLVPLEAHLASSAYSEEQAKLLRAVCGEIQEANDVMVVYMASLQLDDIPPPTDLELPQELIECAAGLSVRPEAVPQLQEAMAKLASVSSDVESSLAEIQALLKEEEEREAEFQAVVGVRPRSIVTELERETRKYHEAHSIASESNLTLHKAMQLHVKNLKLLGSPMQDIQSSIPTLDGLDPATEASLGDMRRIIAKVEEMRGQRAQLEGELRAAVQADDITEGLARHGNTDQEKVFQQELQKHDQTVTYIRQNIHAQQNITQAMTERNAEYADARVKVEEVVRRREDSIGSLVASYHAYEDLLTKTTKGLEFYDKLDANVTKLLARYGQGWEWLVSCVLTPAPQGGWCGEGAGGGALRPDHLHRHQDRRCARSLPPPGIWWCRPPGAVRSRRAAP
jgi:tyrosine-protein phosphatase non-receptor type 23